MAEHKTWSVFVLASVVQAYKPGQDEAVAGNLISICLDELEEVRRRILTFLIKYFGWHFRQITRTQMFRIFILSYYK